MTTPPEQQPREAGFFRAIREWGLTRGDNGFLGGVVDGVAQRVGMATVPARIIVAVAAVVLNGIVLLAYAAAWALLPDRRGNIIIQNFGRGIPNVGALIGIAIFTLIGLSELDSPVPFNISGFPFSDSTPWAVLSVILGILVPIAFVGGVVWFIIAMVKRSQNASPYPGATPAAPPPGTQANSAPVADTATGDGSSPDAENADAASPDAEATAASPAAPRSTNTPVYAAMPQRNASASVPPSLSTPVEPSSFQPAPPAPPALPRVPGPGRGFYLASLAWIMLSAAIAVAMERGNELAVHPAAAWFVMMVTGLGVILMAVSLAGRKLGFLGFMTIMLALPLPVVAAGADELRETYAEDGSLLHFDVDFGDGVEQVDTYDATEDFAYQYREVVLNGDCRQDSSIPSDPSSTARLSFTSLDEDTSVDVVTRVTYVSIPVGTDLNVVGQGDAQAHVVWPDRDLTCDFWGAGGQHLTLANNTGPVLDLVVYDDEFANTIVITEVYS
ncbi:PspC domain-containing protein [Demequina sp. TTPB684]|uniref:PspC domain-containing protein n=1 Tax=unclassified Demequina TaxID=2620311 RepID=UPI001CF3F9B2|nr:MULTISPECIES: PspC domain-containing protein [unclassified Demequina]MCB2411483.1 PspC domain-containing protein [Demequina sp. TTPB684]UPU88465.1 PspC domain-containing protein [Demequina sp. TMPB413]